ncbi:unnamed protein product [Arabis nemorensis]|uniref:dolichyl-P-Man:Man5GlcNAc2-PP-dolichol alpha-1,3-mannosyltransferase n=1 Tax=Arabis nemorensis TaxID=586526 RepID=A0A565BQK3_9BRAS|nr:unnamed protein product [Arabis nemorensis]
MASASSPADMNTSRRASRSRRHGKETNRSDLFKNPKIPFAIALILADAILVALIIVYVPYTKIDWDAYMSQVSGFLGGERDYGNLKGDTGPLVYPAGFLYVYSLVQNLTGGEVYPAQILFGVLYIVNLAIVLFIYVKTDVVPWWALSLLCLSKRIHSIFVLRLFNDCFAMTLLHASMALFLYRKWHIGMVAFSGAVSIKMNVLLYAPPLLLLLLKAMNIIGVVSALAGAALVQILVGLPFLITYPVSYIANAFDLGRVFIHFWSVNFKFVPERVFVSKEFAVCLLIAHLCLLAVFANYKWCKHEGGIIGFMRSRHFFLTLPSKPSLGDFSASRILTKEHIVTTMFVGDFIGIVCARSLHYQFYSWYFYSLPFLLWRTMFPSWLRVILFLGIEICWNVYPSTPVSSGLLMCLHFIILLGLWFAPSDNPYQDHQSQRQKKA